MQLTQSARIVPAAPRTPRKMRHCLFHKGFLSSACARAQPPPPPTMINNGVEIKAGELATDSMKKAEGEHLTPGLIQYLSYGIVKRMLNIIVTLNGDVTQREGKKAWLQPPGKPFISLFPWSSRASIHRPLSLSLCDRAEWQVPRGTVNSERLP